jgi:NDP-sugar pyrophosphorylase family protein
MKTVILAGGKGTRLKPYTAVLPKPLMPVDDVPILEIILRQLKSFGLDEITVTVGHLASLIETFFGDGSKFGVKIEYFREDKPLGTIGSLRLIEGLGNDFLVMNGDTLTDLEIPELIDDHVRNSALATIATYTRNQHVDFGVMELGDNGKIIGFTEKPTYPYNVSMGIYVFNRGIIDFIPAERPFGFDELMLELLEREQEVRSYPYDGYWLDLGRPDDYEIAVRDFSEMRSEFLKES